MGSVSTINSLTRACDGRRVTAARQQPMSESSKRLRKVEEHVVSLVKSVGSLTSDVRETDKLREQVSSLKKDMCGLQQQVSQLQLRLSSHDSKYKTDSYEKLYSSVKKPSKISRCVLPVTLSHPSLTLTSVPVSSVCSLTSRRH